MASADKHGLSLSCKMWASRFESWCHQVTFLELIQRDRINEWRRGLGGFSFQTLRPDGFYLTVALSGLWFRRRGRVPLTSPWVLSRRPGSRVIIHCRRSSSRIFVCGWHHQSLTPGFSRGHDSHANDCTQHHTDVCVWIAHFRKVTWVAMHNNCLPTNTNNR